MRALITQDVGQFWQRLPADLDARFCPGTIAGLNAALADDIEILVTDALPTAIEHSAGLRWVQLLSSGANQFLDHPLRERDLLVSSAAGICAVHIAEFVVGRILYHTRAFGAFARYQQARTWPDRAALAGPSLRGQRAVLIGYGGVGRETARLLAAFGVEVVAVARAAARRPYTGYRPYPDIGDPEARLPQQVVAAAELPAVLPDADFVVVCAALNPATYHLLDAALLARLKPAAIVINVARGAIVETAALLRALDAGRFAHAYLDVFEEEPLPVTSPLWSHEHISLTPHMAGVMPDAAVQLEELFLANLVRYRQGARLINQLDWPSPRGAAAGES
jgi:phosphoglycerate dehydrogenase-like enzyme